LLIEEQRTNLLTYSEQFDNAAWSIAGVTRTDNVAVSPSGATTAESLVATVTSGVHLLFNTTAIAVTANATTTVTSYVKANGYNFASLSINDNTANFTTGETRQVYNLASGTVGTAYGLTTGQTASITPVGNGWFRISLTQTFASTGRNISTGPMASDVDPRLTSYTGNGTSGIFLWGAQLEAGAFATSYIPTVASQVTRAADSASMIGNNFARWYNVNAGTLYAEGSTEYSGTPTATRVLANIRSTDDANRISIRFGSNASERGGSFFVFSNSTTSAQINEGSALVADQSMKFAGAYAVNDFAFAKNNVLVGTDTSGALPVGVTELQLGASNLCGNIKRIAYYNRRLANTELTSITS
jgi:hypothetical protein